VFVPGKPFQPRLMFARAYLKQFSGATIQGRLLALPRLDRLARDKHTSLLQKFVTLTVKCFIPAANIIKLF